MIGLDAIKAATWDLHRQAERSGIIADILAGHATQYGVALLLRNLLPVYQILDVSPFCPPALARSASIEADLTVLSPRTALPLLAEGAAYTEMVCRAAKVGSSALIAHAYVRYLGDLNGGGIMQRLIAVCLGDVARKLTFQNYPALLDKATFARDYRVRLDEAVRSVDQNTAIHESLAAFEINIALSNAVKADAARLGR